MGITTNPFGSPSTSTAQPSRSLLATKLQQNHDEAFVITQRRHRGPPLPSLTLHVLPPTASRHLQLQSNSRPAVRSGSGDVLTNGVGIRRTVHQSDAEERRQSAAVGMRGRTGRQFRSEDCQVSFPRFVPRNGRVNENLSLPRVLLTMFALDKKTETEKSLRAPQKARTLQKKAD